MVDVCAVAGVIVHMTSLAGRGTLRVFRPVVIPASMASGLSCHEPTVGFERFPVVTVSPGTADLRVGDTLRFRATGSGQRLCDCRWTTSDERVAVIEVTGLLRGVSAGQATVTATAVADANAKASALVQVRAP